jgi:hypothetical protein
VSDLPRDRIQRIPLCVPPARTPPQAIRDSPRNDVQMCMWHILSGRCTIRQ